MTDAKKRAALERLESRIDQLPLLPDVVVSLLRLDPNAEDYFDRVAGLIRSDPTYAMRLLRYANSASVATRQPVTTIEHALMLVGCKGAVGLVVGQSAMRVFIPSHDWERDLWRHAFDVACLTQALAARWPEGGLDLREVYLYGLLHDIGRFILYLESPDELRAVDETAWTTPQELIDAETAICGFTHAELGYLAIRKWRLPDTLAQIVRHHHDPPDQTGDLRHVVQLIQDADWISVTLAVHQDLWRTLPTDELCQRLSKTDLKAHYGIDEEGAMATVCAALRQSTEMQAALGIAPRVSAT